MEPDGSLLHSQVPDICLYPVDKVKRLAAEANGGYCAAVVTERENKQQRHMWQYSVYCVDQLARSAALYISHRA
jgi:hypothetical protein